MAAWVLKFSNGDTRLERILRKNQYTQRKLLNFGFSKNLNFEVNFLCQKSFENFSVFFSLKNTNLEAQFFAIEIL